MDQKQVYLDDVFAYIDSHHEYFLEELRPLIEQKSISTRNEGVEECASILADMLRRYGLSNVAVYPTAGRPVVYGEIIEDPSYPTMLMYGHYDVQPAEPLEAWDTDPFKMVIKDGRMFCRGGSDNKAQFFAALMGMVSYRKVRGKLPINIKYLFEGEEEIGSIHLADFAREHKEMLKADACIYSDGCYHENGKPILILGLKGSVYTEIIIRGANRDTHSMRNTCIPSPVWRMAELLASMRGEGDMDGKVLIEGFYDNVRPLTQLEIDTCAKIPVDEELLKESYGIDGFVKCPGGGTYYHNLMFEPGCNVNGLFAGYTGPGFKGVIPNMITARVNFSLVPDMSMAEIREKIRKHVQKFGDDIELRFIDGGFEPSRTPIDNKYVEICAKAVEDGFGEYPILFPGVGGAGPNYVFEDILGMPAIEIPFADALQNNHAPNESQILSGFFNGIRTSAAVIERFPR